LIKRIGTGEDINVWSLQEEEEKEVGEAMKSSGPYQATSVPMTISSTISSEGRCMTSSKYGYVEHIFNMWCGRLLVALPHRVHDVTLCMGFANEENTHHMSTTAEPTTKQWLFLMIKTLYQTTFSKMVVTLWEICYA
jgi:hypothetical protein